jgi:hypothetical protein
MKHGGLTMTSRFESEKELICQDCGVTFQSKYAKRLCPACYHEQRLAYRRAWYASVGKKRYSKPIVTLIDPKNDKTFFETPEEAAIRRANLRERLFGSQKR